MDDEFLGDPFLARRFREFDERAARRVWNYIALLGACIATHHALKTEFRLTADGALILSGPRGLTRIEPELLVSEVKK